MTNEEAARYLHDRCKCHKRGGDCEYCMVLYWGLGECMVSPEPEATCGKDATEILREPFTPRGFIVMACKEHADELAREGYERATV